MTIFEAIGKYIIAPTLVGLMLLVGQRVQLYWQKQKTKRSIEKNIVRDLRIKEVLVELRVLLRAERAYVSLFHNGEYYIDGSDKGKKSRTHEVVKEGVSYEAHNFQNVVVSLMTEEMVMLSPGQPKFLCMKDVPDSNFRRKYEVLGVQSLARYPLMSGKNIIGFVGADFDTCVEAPEIDIIPKVSWKIEQILLEGKKS
jgi:hypothetical protein